MSPVPPPRRRVARHRAKDYWQVATHLMESARALVTLGDEEYGNAIGICLIHAVISAGGAVTINVAEYARRASSTRTRRVSWKRWCGTCLSRCCGRSAQSSKRSLNTNMRGKSSHKRRRKDCSTRPSGSTSGRASNSAEERVVSIRQLIDETEASFTATQGRVCAEGEVAPATSEIEIEMLIAEAIRKGRRGAKN